MQNKKLAAALGSALIRGAVTKNLANVVNSSYADTVFAEPWERFKDRSLIPEDEADAIDDIVDYIDDEADTGIYNANLLFGTGFNPHYNPAFNAISNDSTVDVGIIAHEAGHALNAKDKSLKRKLNEGIITNTLANLGMGATPLAIAMTPAKNLKDQSSLLKKVFKTKKGLAGLAALLASPQLIEEARASFKGSKLINDHLEDASVLDLLKSWKGFPTYAMAAASPYAVAKSYDIPDEVILNKLNKIKINPNIKNSLAKILKAAPTKATLAALAGGSLMLPAASSAISTALAGKDLWDINTEDLF